MTVFRRQFMLGPTWGYEGADGFVRFVCTFTLGGKPVDDFDPCDGEAFGTNRCLLG